MEVMSIFPRVYEDLVTDQTQGEVFDVYICTLNKMVQILGKMMEELPEDKEMETECESSEESPSIFYTRKQFVDQFSSCMNFAFDVVTHIYTTDNNGRNYKEAFMLLLSLFQTPALMKSRLVIS